ncbi:rhodanese-like domain-containing protein [Cohnella lubricantis]|uniref:Rhodanese-like domain-containing protein n=1 Tax=Cohnella lubricantis TaxID=2163172 RepID=A0A841TAZ6_9BACL|nr:rhodanese-like domain-containing protein [Cohnella lubricantis]MBB6677256.1 rhodanese-like domain-containing protein [Cohnella lubricantis]MBP2116933.1 rhodanese-related sulfurtransferase [Cohnella lubricantis]
MSYATTTVDQLKSRLDAGEKPILIDVREDEEVAAGMIDGAIHIPMGEIPDRLADIPRDREVIFICRSGGRSGRVCEYLEAQGFGNIVNMQGGMLAWNDQ